MVFSTRKHGDFPAQTWCFDGEIARRTAQSGSNSESMPAAKEMVAGRHNAKSQRKATTRRTAPRGRGSATEAARA